MVLGGSGSFCWVDSSVAVGQASQSSVILPPLQVLTLCTAVVALGGIEVRTT